jgi:hypothetical protein
MIHNETTEFSWDTMEYEHRDKSTDWYWALGILTVVGSAIAFLTKNILFGFLILFGGFLVGIFASKKPDPISIEISTHGIEVNKKLFYFKDIAGFWIYRNMFGVRKLILKTARNFAPMVSIPIPEDVRASELRLFLLDFLTETELQESFTDLFLEKIGF